MQMYKNESSGISNQTSEYKFDFPDFPCFILKQWNEQLKSKFGIKHI